MSEPTPIPVKFSLRPKRLLRQMVQDEIKAYIIENGLKPGDPIPTEAELAERFDVSRTSIREAVKALEALEVLEVRRGAGLFIRKYSIEPLLEHLSFGIMFEEKDLTDCLEVRMHLESGLVERAIGVATPEQIARLRVILKRIQTAAKDGTYSVADDMLFHQTLWENVDNKIMGNILHIFFSIFQKLRERSSITEPTDLKGLHGRHKAILDALENKNAAAMREAIVNHYVGIDKKLRLLQYQEQAD